MHPEYDRITQDYDVAVVELKTPLVFNDRIQPIPLPDENDVLYDDTMCLVTGELNEISIPILDLL